MTAPLEVQILCKKSSSVAWTLLKCLWKYLNIFSFFPFNASRPGSWLLSFISCGNRIPFNVSRPGSWDLIFSFISLALVSPLMYPVLGPFLHFLWQSYPLNVSRPGSWVLFFISCGNRIPFNVSRPGSWFFPSFPVAIESSVCRVRTVLVTVQMGVKP